MHVSGGTAAVETESLVALADRLWVLADEAVAIRVDLDFATTVIDTSPSGAPAAAMRAAQELERARIALHLVEAEARFLSLGLSAAARGYTVAEDAARWTVGAAVDGWAYSLGLLAPLIAGPFLVAGGALLLASPEQRNAVLSNPTVIRAIRAITMGADDAILARLGVPPGLVALLGDQGLGITGVPFAASAVAAFGRPLGLLQESPVRVTDARPSPRVPLATPATFSDRFSRIPISSEDDGAQVRIETYEMPDGTRRYEVYVGATVDFDPAAVGEPFDMASNISNAMGAGSGSYDAVLAAMAEAGIRPDDEVQFTGYSQGAATAAHLATSGGFNTQGLVTFGGATGQIPIPDTVNAVIVEHTDDPVAALGGAQENTHAVIVERWASAETDFSDAPILPGHQRPGYVETAGLMDGSTQTRLTDAAASLTAFSAGGRLVSSVDYVTARVDAPELKQKVSGPS